LNQGAPRVQSAFQNQIGVQNLISSQATSTVQTTVGVQSILQATTPLQVPAQIQSPLQSTTQLSSTLQLQVPAQILTPLSITPSFQVPVGGAEGPAPLSFRNVKAPSFGKGGRFTVELRRFGKFKPIGITTSLSKALRLGRNRASNTLGATFRIKGGAGKVGAPPGFYTSKKSPNTFIEKPRYRLSTSGEIGEIQFAKAKKKRRKR